MAQCLIHEEATSPADALTLELNVSVEKKQLPYYLSTCQNVSTSII